MPVSTIAGCCRSSTAWRPRSWRVWWPPCADGACAARTCAPTRRANPNPNPDPNSNPNVRPRAAHTAPKPLSTFMNDRANAHLASQVRLNTDKRLYAFNWMQQQALPEGYVPPKGSAAGGKG